MKIFVAVKFKPFMDMEYVGVSKTKQGALSILRKRFPYMRGSIELRNLSSDNNDTYLLDVIEQEI